MRKGVKIFIALMVATIIVLLVGPAVMMAFQGGHP